MQASKFNLRVPLGDDEVFLMNTLSDAQLIASRDVAALLDDPAVAAGCADPSRHEALATLAENGFLVESAQSELEELDTYFTEIREDTTQLRVTVLTTLQCNFACDYCFQGDHGDYNVTAAKMSLETAARVADWIEGRLDQNRPERFVLTFFGGEPLLNLSVMYYLAERLWKASGTRSVEMLVNVITNGLLLTRDVVDRLAPCGLNGVKVTLDGDRETHNRHRPLRGGQGTFDRIIRNIRDVSERCRVSIGGNFDEASLQAYPALLDFLAQQEFAGRLAKVSFKPTIKGGAQAGSGAGTGSVVIPLVPVADGRSVKPLNGTCMTAAGAAARSSSPCDTCHFSADGMSFLREETKKRGLPTVDGVHMGPCEIHRKHAYTIGPDGSLYACPGFTGDPAKSTGHIDGTQQPWQTRARHDFERLAAWKACGDCSFIPVCGGGCSVASQMELGDMHTPTCHKHSFESALIALAQDVRAGAGEAA